MQKAVRKYLKALEASDVDKAAALFTPDGWVQSPFLGRLPVRAYIAKVASASSASELTVHDVLVSAEGHMRAVAYYLYDWRLKDGSKVAFECADVFNFDPDTGRIASVVLVYDTHLIRDAVENKYPGRPATIDGWPELTSGRGVGFRYFPLSRCGGPWGVCR